MDLLFYSSSDAPDAWRAEFARLLPAARFHVWQDEPVAADYALVWKPPAAFFDGQTRLKAVFALGAGVDALLPHIPPRWPLIRLEDSGMGEQMADYVTHHLLGWFYGYFDYHRATGWHPQNLPDKQDWTVGVLGLGQLGQTVVARMQALGFPVTGWSRTPRQLPGVTTYAGEQELPAFLSGCRVLVSLLPLTAETEDLIDETFLSRLPSGAYLINVARGRQVVDEAVLSALDSGQLAGAALDVFREEPLAANHPYWSHPKVLVTPHIAAITPIRLAAEQIATKLQAFENGQAVSGQVDRQRGY